MDTTSEARFRGLLEAAPDAMICTGRSDTHTSTNFSRSSLDTSRFAYSTVRKNREFAHEYSSVSLPRSRRYRIGLCWAFAAALASPRSVYQYSRENDASRCPATASTSAARTEPGSASNFARSAVSPSGPCARSDATSSPARPPAAKGTSGDRDGTRAAPPAATRAKRASTAEV